MIRLGLLGSTRGTLLFAIAKAIEQKKLAASIELVISNKSDALILTRAKTLGMAAHFIDPTSLSREDYDKHVSNKLKESRIDMVVLIGYMRILSQAFVTTWKNKIINVHPSLLPAFAGKMDLAVHRAVLSAAMSETGCTVHYVTETVDAGPIILQKKCPVLREDTPETLKERVQALESDALVAALQLLGNNNNLC